MDNPSFTTSEYSESSYNMESPLLETLLPQFSSVTPSDTAQIVPTRALSDAEKKSGFPIDIRPSIGHLPSSSQRLGSRTSSAFVPILAGRAHNPSSAFSLIESSIQFSSFKTNAHDCTIHSLNDNADDNDGFFLLSPSCAQLDRNSTFGRQRREFSSRGLHFKETKSPRPRSTSTRTMRKQKIFLQPRPKRTSMFL